MAQSTMEIFQCGWGWVGGEKFWSYSYKKGPASHQQKTDLCVLSQNVQTNQMCLDSMNHNWIEVHATDKIINHTRPYLFPGIKHMVMRLIPYIKQVLYLFKFLSIPNKK